MKRNWGSRTNTIDEIVRMTDQFNRESVDVDVDSG